MVDFSSVKVGLSDIVPSTSVRNLNAWFDIKMLMNEHINKICSKAFRGLHNIRTFLTTDATKTLAHAFVASHWDYCNLLLLGLPAYQQQQLQKVFNAPAQVTCLTPKNWPIKDIQ